jgi:hypothetical protein
MSSQELRRQLESLQEATVASPQLFEASPGEAPVGFQWDNLWWKQGKS